MSKFNLNIDGSIDQDKIVLCDRLLHKKVEIYPVENMKISMNLNSDDKISFKTYKYNNGNMNPLWKELDDIAIILVEGKGYFEISVPKTVEDCDYKEITGISLCEAETSQTNVTLEINTENDIVRDDYVPTILYNPNNTEGSLLHRVFKSLPHYQIGYVDDSIAGIERVFSCDDQSVYDFLQTVAEELECIFIFDNFSRTVNCYKLDDFGVDSGVIIDGTENLAENITLTGDKDSVKNCFKIEGADDVISDRIGNRLIGGNNIWKFSEYQLNQMSDTLQKALNDRELLVQSHQSNYNALWDEYNALKEKITYYKSGMMPSQDTDETTAETVYHDIFGSNAKITYGCVANKNQRADAVAHSLEKFAQALAPGKYTIELQDVTGTPSTGIPTSISFKVYTYLAGQYKEDGKTLKDTFTSETITLPVKDGSIMYYDQENNVFTTDYYLYLKQKMDIMEAKSNITDEVISFEPPLTDATYDNEENPNNYSSIHYSMYCINRLQSFSDAYEACSQVLADLNSNISSDSINLLKYIKPDGSKDNIYEALLGKYGRYMELITVRINYLQDKIGEMEALVEKYDGEISAIRDICDMKKFLTNYENGIHGDNLWIELCSFRRQDTYKNDNYIGEDVDEATLMKNVEGLIKRAEEEISKACEIHYSISTTLDNLLTMWEFQPFWDNFDLGNYIHVRIDEEVYKMRLLSIIYDYDNLEHIEVEFSEIAKAKSPVTDLREIIQQASSMASSFNFVARQAEKGSIANTEFNDMKKNGLAIANTMILDAQNQKPLIDEHGITGRKWNDVTESYDPEQSRLTGNLLCFTDDGWKHTKCALGKICYYDKEKGEYVWVYGLIADTLVGQMLMSEKCQIVNKSGTYVINDDGFKMSKGKSYIMFDPNNPSIVAHNKDGEDVLDFNSGGNGELVIKGKIDGGSIDIGNGNFKVNENGEMTCKVGSIDIDTDYGNSNNKIALNYDARKGNAQNLNRTTSKIDQDYIGINREFDFAGDKREASIYLDMDYFVPSICAKTIVPTGGTFQTWDSFEGKISLYGQYVNDDNGNYNYPHFKSNVPFYSTNVKSGSVVKNITARDTRFTVDVELDKPMHSRPNVIVTPETTNVAGQVFVTVANVTNKGFTIHMRRTDTTGNLRVNWVAMC